MIYKLENTELIRDLFQDFNNSLPLSCVDKIMGDVYVTDTESPRSAMTCLGGFAEYSGEPDRELLSWMPEGVHYLVPHSDEWAELIESCLPEAVKFSRYGIRKDTKFCREKLEAFIAAVPPEYELRPIDGEIYDLRNTDIYANAFVRAYRSKEEFFELGRGFVFLKDGRLVSGASAFSRYNGGIEVQVATVQEERGKGLACAACAKLILSCLDDGLYPNWDAASQVSLKLAEKLGYEFSREYICYALKRD